MKKNLLDILFEIVNNYHPKIFTRLKIELSPPKFLGTKLANEIYEPTVHCKVGKLASHQSCEISRRYKPDVIPEDLLRTKIISSNFQQEMKHRKQNSK